MMRASLRTFLNTALTIVLTALAARLIAQYFFKAVGWNLRRKTQSRRELIVARVRQDEQDHQLEGRQALRPEDEDWEQVESYGTGTAKNGEKAEGDWEGIIGFFHPFANAGGGGERVLWAAIRATQKRWPKAICAVYTGDHDATKATILERVKKSFNIQLHSPTIIFLYLSTRHFILGSTYSHFTLLGQSLGSIRVALDAFSLLVPDIFVDTMGYAFAQAFSKLVFPDMPTGAYVHYPTISTDMLGSLDAEVGKGLNAGTGKGLKGNLKHKYWNIFAWMYSWAGGSVDVVMTNSSWTQGHIRELWGPQRANWGKRFDIEVVFPPVAVEEVEQAIEISQESETKREKVLLCIAQFRPEKNHEIIIRAFSQMLHPEADVIPDATKGAKLVLVGSVRDSLDATRVYDLRLLAHELKVKDEVEFICDASWAEILDWLGKSFVGVNGMWNEHFGIGVVEYQAAGLISVVNDSGGPKADIVVDFDGGPTGFHASSAAEYAAAFSQALSLPPRETIAMRNRARLSARRFTEEAFASQWTAQMERLVNMLAA